MASVQEKYKNYLIDAPEEGALSFEEFTGALASIGNKEANEHFIKSIGGILK